MIGTRVKYAWSAVVLLLFFGQTVAGGSMLRSRAFSAVQDTVQPLRTADSIRPRRAVASDSARIGRRRAPLRDSLRGDSLAARGVDTARLDSLPQPFAERLPADTVLRDTLQRDTVKTPREPSAFLDSPIFGKNTDSLVYDVRNKLVYVYNEGDITYESNNLKADFMRIDMGAGAERADRTQRVQCRRV